MPLGHLHGVQHVGVAEVLVEVPQHPVVDVIGAEAQEMASRALQPDDELVGERVPVLVEPGRPAHVELPPHDLPADGDGVAKGISVKEAVLPWNRFRRMDGRGVDAVLGPEMRSTGEVMGISSTFGASYAKSQISAFGSLPKSGSVFISLADKDKESGLAPAQSLAALGFRLFATSGTADFLASHDVMTARVRKASEGSGPYGEKTIVELLNGGEIDLVINTPVGRGTRADGWAIRTAAIQRSIPCITTTAGFSAAVEGIKVLQAGDLDVRPIQEWLKD